MVERWSSKPYAWVRFLLPLYKISFSLQLRQDKISQYNYFDKKERHSLKKINSYKAFAGKLFSKKRFKSGKIYFQPTLQVHKPVTTRRPSLLFHKKHFKTIHFTPQITENFSRFQMFFTNQVASLPQGGTQNNVQPNLLNYDISTRTSYLLSTLNASQKLIRPVAPVLKKNVIFTSSIKTKNLKTYYTNLQPRSTRFTTQFHLLKKLTSRYDFVRKVRNSWENFSNQKNHFSRFTRPTSPTFHLNSSSKLNLSFPQALGSTSLVIPGVSQHNRKVIARTSNLFNRIFAKNLFSSFLIYKRFYLFSPLLTELPDKLIKKNLQAAFPNQKHIFSNVLCANLSGTPKLFLNLKNTKAVKLQTNFLCWYNFLLIRFLQHTTGLKVSLMFNPYLHKSLSLTERAQLDLWTQRVKGFQRIIGPKISLKESLQVTYLSLKLKDPSLLSSWLSRTIHKVSFWKYRAFFRYLKFLLQNLFLPSFPSLGMKGVKLKLKGKVSVAGNARTRSIYYRVGSTGQSTFSSKVLHNLTFFYTFTGILGLQIWFYF